jgi:signal transduction histidine kinase
VTTQYEVVRVGQEFVANASHELRTPITIIHGFAETLHDNRNLEKSLVHDITGKILRSCERMESLIQNLLLLADLESHRAFNYRVFAFDESLDRCIEQFRILHPSIRPETQIRDCPLLISGQEDLIELMVMNLLNNAVKYSKEQPIISIRAYRDHSSVVFSIEDRGIGIPREDIDHIFKRFYTVDKARSRRLGGAGLGLALVKTIVDQHSGHIDVVSEENKGTTFTIRFPMATDLNPF